MFVQKELIQRGSRRRLRDTLKGLSPLHFLSKTIRFFTSQPYLSIKFNVIVAQTFFIVKYKNFPCHRGFFISLQNMSKTFSMLNFALRLRVIELCLPIPVSIPVPIGHLLLNCRYEHQPFLAYCYQLVQFHFYIVQMLYQ